MIIDAAEHGASESAPPEHNGEVLRACVLMAKPGDIIRVPPGRFVCSPALYVPRGITIAGTTCTYNEPLPNALVRQMARIWNFRSAA